MIKVRPANYRQLSNINRKLDQLLALVEQSSANSQPPAANHQRLAKQTRISLPTSVWNDYCSRLADDCPEYKSPDGTPNKLKISQDIRPISSTITTANIEQVFKSLREKSEANVPF